MAKARFRGICLRDIMNELSVNVRTARRMARELEDLYPGVVISNDDERRRWWKLSEVPYIQLLIVTET